LEKQLAIEVKKKEAERKMTLEKIPKSPLPVVHAAEQAAKMVGANSHYVTDAKKIEHDALCSLDMMPHATPCVSFVKKRHL
jgi:hypothetical protein